MQQDVTARSVAAFKNISELVHAVIRNIHTYGAGGSCRDSERQLKPNLPQFCHLNWTIFRTLTSGSVHCCSTAECLYVSQSNTTSARKTDAERKRTSRQNSDSRQKEQSVNTARRKKCWQDNDVRQREQSVDTARRKTCRQDTDMRQREQSVDTASHGNKTITCDNKNNLQIQPGSNTYVLHNRDLCGNAQLFPFPSLLTISFPSPAKFLPSPARLFPLPAPFPRIIFF